jgi:hypothetical protein
MNDYQETHWAREKFYKALKKLNDQKLSENIEDFCKHEQINRCTPYICSFSKNGDLLSQWRAYAADGSGISIGFNSEYFELSERFPTTTMALKDSISMMDTVYNEDIQDKLIESIIKQISETSSSYRNGDVDIYWQMGNLLNGFCYIFKNPAFSEEKEVRIIHTPTIMGNQEGGTNILGNVSDIKYRVSKNRLTPYFELAFSDTTKMSPLDEIIVGPKAEISSYELEMFLSINGFGKTKYKRSSASYR